MSPGKPKSVGAEGTEFRDETGVREKARSEGRWACGVKGKARSEVRGCSVRGVSKVNWGFLVWGCIGFMGKVKSEGEVGVKQGLRS